MKSFPKRRYHGIGEFVRDLRSVWGVRGELMGILRGKTIDAAFRERLMLGVTAVNRCRYCSFAHTRLGLKSGVKREEIDSLFAREPSVPERERAAVLYAQHWAENEGRPDEEALERIKQEYGPAAAAGIHATLRLIYLNNLCGNTFDWFLYTITFGVLGGV